MASAKGLHVEKGRVLVRTLTPGSISRRFVPGFSLGGIKIVIRLAVVGAIVTGFAKQGGPWLHSLGQGGFSVILEASSGGQYASGQGRASNRANRGVGKGMIKGQSGLGHFLDIGHGSEFGSVVLEVMDGIILGNEEDDVRPLGPKRGNKEEKKNDDSHDGAELIGKNYFVPMAYRERCPRR